MKEKTIVRENLMTQPGYTGYCGDEHCKPRNSYPLKGEQWPRTRFNGSQFVCPKCGWVSQYPKDFIDRYKLKWNK